MPAYDFRCTSCQTTFEVQRPMGSSAPEVCPDCGDAAKRVFSPVGVAFKGSGFHNTDYKSRPTDESAPPSSPCAAKTGDSSACATCPAAAKE